MPTRSDIFKFDDYKAYLNRRLDNPEMGGGRGARARLSKAIKCQTSYTAQVLSGTAHFSLEQIDEINRFLGHDEHESEYLMTLTLKERAGTQSLRLRLKKKASALKSERKKLKTRTDLSEVLSEDEKRTYYSSWIYAAIHTLVSISKDSDASHLSGRLGVDAAKVDGALDFLCSAQVINKTESGYKVGKRRIHLSSDSPLIRAHHLNWRLRAIEAIQNSASSNNIHYSSALSVSKMEAEEIRELLIQTFLKVVQIVKSSEKQEVALCVNFDFFAFGRGSS